jgi:alkylation response protein AidB-like acyl-CoA dehydrogenase
VTGRSACQAILDVAAGRVPRHVVNRAAIDTPAVRAKLARYAARVEAR